MTDDFDDGRGSYMSHRNEYRVYFEGPAVTYVTLEEKMFGVQRRFFEVAGMRVSYPKDPNMKCLVDIRYGKADKHLVRWYYKPTVEALIAKYGLAEE